jgi:hypothetical protein
VLIYERNRIEPERPKREEPVSRKAKLDSVIWMRGDRRLLYSELRGRGGNLNEERIVRLGDAGIGGVAIVVMDRRFGGVALLPSYQNAFNDIASKTYHRHLSDHDYQYSLP